MANTPETRTSEFSNAAVLIVQTAFVGDLLLSIPLLRGLREKNPRSKLVLLCRKGLGGFMLAAGLVDEVVEVDKGSSRGEGGWREARAKLRHFDFSLILCPHQSVRSALLVSRLKAKRKIAFKSAFNFWIFSSRVVRPMHLPEAMRQLALLTPLDPELAGRLAEYASLQRLPGGRLTEDDLGPVPEWASMKIAKLHDLKRAAEGDLPPRIREILQNHELRGAPLAILAPGSVWPTKMWTLEGFAEIARGLQAAGFRVLALGAGNEKPICEELARSVPGVIPLAGATSLFESSQLIAVADLVVCNDSGAMHMAAAAGTPTVAAFGPTVLDFGYRPWQEAARVAQIKLSCRPCGKHGSQKCPLGTHACMRDLKAESVMRLIGELNP